MDARARDRKILKLFFRWAAPLLLVAAFATPAVASGGGSSPADWNWFDIGYKSKDAAGGELSEGEAHMSPPALFALINAFIFFGLLVWKGGPPIKKFVKQRHLTIKEALEESARLRDEAREKLDDYTQRIANVEAEVEKIFAEIRADAEAEKKRIIASAEAQAEAIKANAEERIVAEMAQARLELEREVVEAAIDAAEKLFRVTATPGDHKGLVDSFIADMADEAPKGAQPPRRPS